MKRIKVERGRYVVVDVVGNTERPAQNWTDLEDRAKSEVRRTAKGRHIGYYPCPDELASQARWRH